ncbi:MAG: hypothetical protein IJG33_14160 [Selenomonadaceae bacterium]|nr:hypothetical protein [Selenomonadaceae bacterium]
MGFFSDLYNKGTEWAEKIQEYYREGMSMSREELREELRRWRRSPSSARYQGYMKAAKERGLA